MVAKVILEIFFFRYKGVKRRYCGILGSGLVILSITAMLSVRIWKAEDRVQGTININKGIERKKTLFLERKKIFKDQIKNLSLQTKLKRTQVYRLNPYKDKWLIRRYSQEADRIEIRKRTLIKKLQDMNQQKILPIARKTGMIRSFSKVLGINPKSFEIFANSFLALLLEAILIFLSFQVSMFHKSHDPVMEKTLDVTKTLEGTNGNTQSQDVTLVTTEVAKNGDKLSQVTSGNMESYSVTEGDNMRIDGSYIKEYRAKKNLTQKEMGKMLDVSRKHISNIENGKATINEKLISQIRDFDSNEI